jgi:hypothetical protein
LYRKGHEIYQNFPLQGLPKCAKVGIFGAQKCPLFPSGKQQQQQRCVEQDSFSCKYYVKRENPFWRWFALKNGSLQGFAPDESAF